MSDDAVVIAGLTVRYGDAAALHRVDLAVARGQTTVLLGPSGSGKTTLLHAVAGFVAPDEGTIAIEGTMVAGPGRLLPPERRKVGMVFQHHALWPHLSVEATVAYPLERNGMGRREAAAEARRLLERLGIAALADRRPDEVSGGEQQRVSLARALARHPAVFLFDEPTAHLDAALRTTLLDEIDGRRRERGAAALYATHDAAEAMSLADRIVLLRDGEVAQTGTPREVYEEPVDLWAARLTGPAATLDVAATPGDPGEVRIEVGEVTRQVAGSEGGGPVLVRPEWTSLGGPLPGVVERVWFRGPHTDYRLATPVGEVIVRAPGPPRVGEGERPGWDLHRVWTAGRIERHGG